MSATLDDPRIAKKHARADGAARTVARRQRLPGWLEGRHGRAGHGERDVDFALEPIGAIAVRFLA